MIRDRLVLGVANTRLRERLLREDNLDLKLSTDARPRRQLNDKSNQ